MSRVSTALRSKRYTEIGSIMDEAKELMKEGFTKLLKKEEVFVVVP